MTPEELKDYTSNKKSNAQGDLTIIWNESSYSVGSLLSSTYIPFYIQATKETAESIRAINLPSQRDPIQMTNADFISLTHLAMDAYQQTIDVFAQILAEIDGLTITTEEEVDIEWDNLMESYVNERVLAPSNQELAVQSDWDQIDSEALDYIKNKPTI